MLITAWGVAAMSNTSRLTCGSRRYINRVNHSHRPHDRQQRQPQPPETEHPEDQIQPERTGEPHLSRHRQRR